MKKILSGLFFSVVVAFASEPMLEATPFLKVLREIPKHKKTFIEVGSEHCHACRKMGRLLYRIKQEHPEYPIFFVDVSKEREAAFKMKVRMIPTQIVVDDKGEEVFRHIGFLKKKEIERVLKSNQYK